VYLTCRMLENALKAMLTSLPLVAELHHPSMSDRHWIQLMKVALPSSLNSVHTKSENPICNMQADTPEMLEATVLGQVSSGSTASCLLSNIESTSPPPPPPNMVLALGHRHEEDKWVRYGGRDGVDRGSGGERYSSALCRDQE